MPAVSRMVLSTGPAPDASWSDAAWAEPMTTARTNPWTSRSTVIPATNAAAACRPERERRSTMVTMICIGRIALAMISGIRLDHMRLVPPGPG